MCMPTESAFKLFASQFLTKKLSQKGKGRKQQLVQEKQVYGNWLWWRHTRICVPTEFILQLKNTSTIIEHELKYSMKCGNVTQETIHCSNE